MELLKFNDSQKSPRRAKNPAGFIGAGIMVAVMGLSSTLAGTITLNAGTSVEFGQGVVTTAACDSSVVITPTSSYDTAADTFTVNSLTVSDINLEGNCRTAALEFRAYNAAGDLLQWRDGNTDTDKALVVYVPSSTSGTSTTGWTKNFYVVTGSTIGNAFTADGEPTLAISVGASGAGAGTITLGNLKVNPSITRITLESREPRDIED